MRKLDGLLLNGGVPGGYGGVGGAGDGGGDGGLGGLGGGGFRWAAFSWSNVSSMTWADSQTETLRHASRQRTSNGAELCPT